MKPELRDTYLASDYRVRLPRGGYASIRIGQPLPAALRACLRYDDEAWAFVTAWNPRSRPQPRAANRRAQRGLLAALRAMTPPPRIRAAIGVGTDGWREPSLWLAGVELAALDILMRRHAQNAIVRGHAAGPAELHVVP
ncbi:MAG TPA: DUF3293 domain-containing protein [Rhodanobacteraceae bacterium]|nr:DUF3293 domain-containing protein [Rhodanobacteraceae bacterium]